MGRGPPGPSSRLGSFEQGTLEPWALRVCSRRACAASGQVCKLGPTDYLPGGEGWWREVIAGAS